MRCAVNSTRIVGVRLTNVRRAHSMQQEDRARFCHLFFSNGSGYSSDEGASISICISKAAVIQVWG